MAAAIGLASLPAARVGVSSSSSHPAATPETAILPLSDGVTIDYLATTGFLPFRPRPEMATLERYTYQAGVDLDRPYVGPVLVYVERGALTLDAVGPAVSIMEPQEVVKEPLTGSTISSRQSGKVLASGSPASIHVGGSAYAEDGDLGPTRNASIEPLVLLVVTFVVGPGSEDLTEIPAEPAPKQPG